MEIYTKENGLKVSSNSCTENNIQSGKQTGFGKYIWSERSAKFNNCVYVGNFLNGKFHGQGTYLFSNGDKFQGNFVNGLIHGSGTYTSSGGDTITGKIPCL